MPHATFQAGRIARLGADAPSGPLRLDFPLFLRTVSVEFFLKPKLLDHALDAANADFTLTPESPAREAGTDVSLSLDIAGHTVPMPEGGVQDIGAYEFFIEAVGFVEEEATQ